MKTIIYLLLGVFIFSMLPLDIIKANEYVRIVIEATDKNISEVDLKRSSDVISGRLNDAGIRAFDIEIEPGKIIVKIPLVSATDSVKNLLIAKGRFEFREPLTQRLILDGSAVESMKTGSDDLGNPSAVIQFKKEAVPVWTKATQDNLNKSIALVLDNRVIYDPVIREVIPNGSSVITGNFTSDELKYISILGNNGELPAEFRIVER